MSVSIVTAELLAYVSEMARKPGPLVCLRRMLARRAIQSAEFCRIVGPHLGLNEDECFAAGLIHDLGAITGLEGAERELHADPRVGPRTIAAWLDAVSDCHVELAETIVTAWKLPASVATAVRDHHARPGAVRDKLTRLVIASDAVTAMLDTEVSINTDDLARVPFLDAPELRDWAMAALGQLTSAGSIFDASPMKPSSVGQVAVARWRQQVRHKHLMSYLDSAECILEEVTEATRAAATSDFGDELTEVDLGWTQRLVSMAS